MLNKNYERFTMELDLKKVAKLSRDIYNAIVLLDYFVQNQNDIEELNNMSSVLKFLRNNADMLYVEFINADLIN